LANINIKFSAVIAIAIIAVVASLSMVDAEPTLNRRDPPIPNGAGTTTSASLPTLAPHKTNHDIK
jgi:hypothetical protein